MDLVWLTRTYLLQGGWVMIPLVAVSVVMWTLIVDRLRRFGELSRGGLQAQLLSEFDANKAGHPQLDREILGACALRLRRGLDGQLAVIGVLAGIAPLLGLLGTVLGMIETFDVISQFGTGNARAMAGGISVALITTQTGLLVAIPGLLMSNRLSRKASSLKTTLDEVATGVSRRIGAGLPVGGEGTAT